MELGTWYIKTGRKLLTGQSTSCDLIKSGPASVCETQTGGVSTPRERRRQQMLRRP